MCRRTEFYRKGWFLDVEILHPTRNTKQPCLQALTTCQDPGSGSQSHQQKLETFQSLLRLWANCCRYLDFQKFGWLPETWQIWVALTCQTISCKQELHASSPWQNPEWAEHSAATHSHSNTSAVVSNNIFLLNSVISNPGVSHFHWPVNRKRLLCRWRWSQVSACQLWWHRSAWDRPDQGCRCCHSYSLSEDIKQDLNPCGQERPPNTLHLVSNISSLPWLCSMLLLESWLLISHAAQRAPATQKTACFER